MVSLVDPDINLGTKDEEAEPQKRLEWSFPTEYKYQREAEQRVIGTSGNHKEQTLMWAPVVNYHINVTCGCRGSIVRSSTGEEISSLGPETQWELGPTCHTPLVWSDYGTQLFDQTLIWCCS